MAREWISRNERVPTASDADVCNCVIAWHIHSGVLVIGYRQVGENTMLTHWMPTPRVPDDFPPEYRELWEKRKG